jgi:ElaB/YqjD/DUF883 family membrane-anchored ribosome-binding protein
MELKVTKEEIVNYEKLKMISEIASIKSKLKQFEKKYKCSFENFKRKVNTSSEEKFEEWDDYIEWKGYFEALEDLESKLKEIENVKNIRLI